MKNHFNIANFLFFTALYLASSHSVMGAVLGFSPSTSTVNPSSSFSLDVTVNDPSDLYDYQFDLTFNPNLFKAVSVSEGSLISGKGNFQPGTIDNNTGEITFIGNSLIGPVSGVSVSGVLTHISFQSLTQNGTGSFSLQNTILQDSNGFDIAHTVSPASISISTGPVPEPEEWAMMLVGAGLVGFQVKRKKALMNS